MNQKMNWLSWLTLMFKEFLHETIAKPQYEVVDVYECKKTGLTRVVIKLAERYSIDKLLSEVLLDDKFIEGLDKKTIRTLTFIATVERFKPDYSISLQQITNEMDEYTLEIKSKKTVLPSKALHLKSQKTKELYRILIL